MCMIYTSRPVAAGVPEPDRDVCEEEPETRGAYYTTLGML